jgi:hypothetical protein
MSEVQPQNAEEGRPAGFDTLELIVPIVRAREEAVHHAYDAGAAGASFNDPLSGERRGVWTQVRAFGGEPARRIPGSDSSA